VTTVAIMQPYLFPYIGYYQLVAAADIFVFLDDVRFIKRGYLNRNRLCDANGQPVPFTLAVDRASQNRDINEHRYLPHDGRLLKTLDHLYRRQPGYSRFIPIVTELLTSIGDRSVATANADSVINLAGAVGIVPRFRFSSEIDPKPTRRGQDRILGLCATLGASRYLNLPGGRALYDAATFAEHGLDLCFLDTTAAGVASAEGTTWQPSFLHPLFTLDPAEIGAQLRRYDLSQT
jgi:hypothetical protein